MKNVLGIMGGMGPLATQLFYKMLIEHTAAEKDQDHINVLIIGDASMPDRTNAILSGDTEPVYEKLRENFAFLAEAGCMAAAVPCNTSHYFIDRIEHEIGIPVINMIKESAREVAKTCRGERVGVLATDGTIKTGLYQKALESEGVEAYTMSEEGQKLVMHEIYDCVKCGVPVDESAWSRIQQELIDNGCRKALLACTELSVIKEEKKLSDYYIDAMGVLAVRSIEYMGKRVK